MMVSTYVLLTWMERCFCHCDTSCFMLLLLLFWSWAYEFALNVIWLIIESFKKLLSHLLVCCGTLCWFCGRVVQWLAVSKPQHPWLHPEIILLSEFLTCSSCSCNFLFLPTCRWCGYAELPAVVCECESVYAYVTVFTFASWLLQQMFPCVYFVTMARINRLWMNNLIR